MEAYFPILNALKAAKVDYAIIGTSALKHYYPAQMKAYVLADCDVVLNPELGNIQNAVKVLQENEWEVKLWEEVVEAAPSIAELKGKFYLRATHQTLRLDLTYECPWIPWAEMKKGIDSQADYPFASIPHVKKLKEIKGSPKDLEVLEMLKQEK